MTGSNIDFPRRCCVSSCRTIVHNLRDANKRLFRFVRRAKAHSANPEFNELIERRFWEWITVLGQNPRNAKSLWICSKHFVNGRPAAPACHWESDWIPNRNLKKGKPNADRRRSSSASNEPLKRNRNHRNNISENRVCLQNEHNQDDADASFSNQEGPFCRLCLRKHVNLRPVFPSPRIDENHIVRIIEQFSSIRLEFEADYNSFVCCDCLKMLEEFHRCREIWQSNDVLLRAFRDRETFIQPVPIESLMEASQQNVESSETFYPEDHEFSTEPTPIVAIPIECLMEGVVAEKSGFSDENTWDQTLAECEHNNNVEMEETIAMHDDADDTKPDIEPLSTTEPTCKDYSNLTSNIKEEPPEELDTDTAEAGQKEMLIRKLMRKIRRETLSPKKKKSKKSSKRNKKSKSRKTLGVIDLTDSDKG